MNRLLLALVLMIFPTTAVYADELWLCDGFIHSDESSSDAFVLRDKGQSFALHLEVDHVLEYVGSNEIIGYEIFVSSSDTDARRAFYIREDGDRLEIQQHGWHSRQSTSSCYRQ